VMSLNICKACGEGGEGFLHLLPKIERDLMPASKGKIPLTLKEYVYRPSFYQGYLRTINTPCWTQRILLVEAQIGGIS